MRVVIPYVAGGLWPEVRDLGVALDAEFVDVGDADGCGYWRLFKRLWAAGKTFINIEMDILPTVEQLEGMWGCSEEWCNCTYPYTFPGRRGTIMTPEGWVRPMSHIASLGCAKFGRELLESSADLYVNGPLRDPVPWDEDDRKIDNRLWPGGAAPDGHELPRSQPWLSSPSAR